MKNDKVVGLIPSRLGSRRLPGKALAEISGMPIIVHTAKRALLSKSLHSVYVCTDSAEIKKACTDFNIECIVTEGNFRNGTERIAHAAQNLDYNYAVDIQGDEPLIDPTHIDKVVEKLVETDEPRNIVLPILRVPYSSSETIVRVQTTISGKVMTLTRAFLPHRYTQTMQSVYKHLSIIGFTKQSLTEYASLEVTPNEECESIELLRALENDMTINTILLQGDSFSVDIQDDLDRARIAMENDPYKGLYQ